MRRADMYDSGDIVSIRFAGVLRHYGVVTARGTVISNSSRHDGVTEQSLDDFADGRSVRLHRRPSDMDGHHVETRARRAIGARYELGGSNCIDLVRHSHRRKPTPWQIGAGTFMAIGDMLSGPKRRW